MLSRTAFQVARAAPTSAFAPLASTSRAVPLLHAPAQLPSPQRAPFSVSAPAGESRGKRKTRLVRKANLDKKAQLVRQHEQSRPDPVLGYAQGNQELWDKSLLKQILLRREDVWAGKGGAGSAGEGTAASSSSSKEHYTPQLFNFGLTAETAHQLSDLLPPTAALRSTLGDQATSVGSVMVSRFEDATRAEQDKRDTLMRIVDLRNADSKGIEVENTRRIVEAFGRVPGDTASPEVQAAILTMRIRSLSSHLIALPRDIQNRQALRLMISRRTRVLKYLRKVSVTRYEDVLDKIGVEPRAVEGEVVITKEDLRTMIRGQ